MATKGKIHTGRLAFAYDVGAGIVMASVSYVNWKNGSTLVRNMYGSHDACKEAQEETFNMAAASVGKGVIYGLGWPISVPKMYYDYIGNHDFRKHTCPRYNEDKYKFLYKANDFVDSIFRFFNQ